MVGRSAESLHRPDVQLLLDDPAGVDEVFEVDELELELDEDESDEDESLAAAAGGLEVSDDPEDEEDSAAEPPAEDDPAELVERLSLR